MKLYMVELPVRHFEQSLAWYRDQFGLTVEILDPANQFALFTVDSFGRVAIKGATTALACAKVHVEVNNLDEQLAALAMRGVYPKGDLKSSHEGYRRALVHDPDGHEWILFQWVK